MRKGGEKEKKMGKGELMKELQDTGCKMQVNRQLKLIGNGNGQVANSKSSGSGNFPYSLFSYLVVVLFLIASAGIASAADSGDGVCVGATTNFTCGDTVFESCTFNGSMSCPTGHGLVVDADGIVIDGNGYCLDGVSPDDCGSRAGVFSHGYDNVTIKNLEVENFCNGILLHGEYDPIADIWVFAEVGTIDNCKVHDNGNPAGGETMVAGINMKAFKHINITNNEVYNNTGKIIGSCEDGGTGIRLHTECNYCNIINNTIYGNRMAGIFSKMMCEHNYVAYNNVYENGEVNTFINGGIRLMCKKTNFWTVEHNTVTANIGPGIFVRGDDATLRYNTVKNSTGNGIHIHGSVMDQSTGNILNGNTVCENEPYDIYVATQYGAEANGDENTCDTTEGWNDDRTTGCTYSCASAGICGDVTGDEDINMGDVARLLYYVSYPGEYAIGSEWAADVNCDESINMGDVARLLYYVSYPGEYELGCCET